MAIFCKFKDRTVSYRKYTLTAALVLMIIGGLGSLQGIAADGLLTTAEHSRGAKGVFEYEIWARTRSPIMAGDPVVIRAGFGYCNGGEVPKEWRVESIGIKIDERPVLAVSLAEFASKGEMGIPGKRQFRIPDGEINVEPAAARGPCRWHLQAHNDDKNGTTFHFSSEGMVPGQHEAVVEAQLSRGPDWGSREILKTTVQFDVLEKGTDPIRLLNDCNVNWRELAQQISVGPVYCSPRRIDTNFVLSQPAPIDLAFDVYLTADGQEHRVGILYWKLGEAGTASLFCDSGMRVNAGELESGTTRILLKSSRSAISRTLTMYSACNGQVDVGPVELRGGNPLAPPRPLSCRGPNAP